MHWSWLLALALAAGCKDEGGTEVFPDAGPDAAGDADADADADTDSDADADADADGDADWPFSCEDDPFGPFERACSENRDCAIAAHQVDCCGSVVYIGLATSAQDEFASAENLCRLAHPAECGCMAETTTEDGQVVTNPADAVARCNDDGRCFATLR